MRLAELAIFSSVSGNVNRPESRFVDNPLPVLGPFSGNPIDSIIPKCMSM